MKLSILWDDGIKTENTFDNYLFDDVGFNALLKQYFSRFFNNVIRVLKYIPNSKTIKLRQEVLSDFLNDKDDLLGDVKNQLDELIYLYNLLDLKTSIFMNKVNFLIYILKYIYFIEKSSESLSKLTLESIALIKLKDRLNQIKTSELFINLSSDAKRTYDEFSTLKRLVIGRSGKYLSVYQSNSENVINALEAIAVELNISLSERTRLYAKSKLDDSIIEELLKLNPDINKSFEDFYYRYNNKLKFEFVHLSDELEFYIFYKKFFEFIASKELPYSKVNINNNYEINIKGLYDISLIDKVEKIVPNNFSISSNNNIQIVTGVNSGGKTSYIKSLGLNYILFLTSGYIVAREASVHVFKNIFTHFPALEKFDVGKGRFYDELARIEKFRDEFSKDTFLLLNETFSSTSEDIAVEHSIKLLNELIEAQVFCIYVTHQRKILSFCNENNIELYSPKIDINDSNKRLYIIQKENDNLASYTYEVLYKYGLTKEQLEGKLKNEKS